MSGDVLHLFGRSVVEKNVRIGRPGTVLLKRDVLLIIGHRADVETLFVFVDQGWFERVDRHFKDIEETRISFIRRVEECLAVVTPVDKICFHFVARREIAFAAVKLTEVDVTVFVSSAIVRIKKARVFRKIRNGEGAFFC
jgi:hypothetical protein